MALLEIACFSPESAIVASEAGADRVELCENPAVGGTTPPLRCLEYVKARAQTPVFVMIRPRGGDFLYSDAEFQTMKNDIQRFKSGADGFVFGILNAAQEVDRARTQELVQDAHPLPCTFHRAFDEAPNLTKALEDVVSTGCKAILSSGGALNAGGGREMLTKLLEIASGRIVIIPGGGVRSRELASIRQAVQARVYHSSAILDDSGLPDSDEVRRLKAILSS